MYSDSVCYNKLSEHQGSCHCRLNRQNCSDFVLLFCIISLLLQLYFQLFALFQNKKSSNQGWNSMQITCQLHHSSLGNVVGSIQQQGRLNLGPQRCLLPQQGQNRHQHPLGRHYGCMKAALQCSGPARMAGRN